MKAKAKRMIAVLMTLAMVVTGMYYLPQTNVTTKADDEWTSVPGYTRTSMGGGYTPMGQMAQYVTQGAWDLWDWDADNTPSNQPRTFEGAISYKGSGNPYQNLTLRIDEPSIFTAAVGGSENVMGMGTTFQLSNNTTYEYTIKYMSTQAGSAAICLGAHNYMDAPSNPVVRHQVVAGENILKGFISVNHNANYSPGSVYCYFYPTDGITALPAGTEINFTEISFKSIAEITGSTVNGKCGNNVNWSLNRSTGFFGMTGSGLCSFNAEGAPWYALKDDIQTASISADVTNIGRNAFNECSNMTDIYIYNDECSIYDNAATIASGATIHGYAGSTAQTYAQTYNRTFVEIGANEEPITDEPDEPTTDDEWIPVAAYSGGEYTPAYALTPTVVGIWNLYVKEGYGEMSYQGSGVTTNDMKLKTGSVSRNGAAAETKYYIEDGKTYSYTVRFTSTNAGTANILLYYTMGAPIIYDTVVAGENEFTGTFTCGYEGYNSFDFIPSGLPVGTIIDFEEITIEEVVEETSSAEPTTDDGWTPVTPGQAGQYDPIIYVTPVVVGQWSLYAKDGYGAMSYQGSGATASDMKLRIESCTTASLLAGTHYYMESGKTYNYTVRFTSTNAGEADVQLYYTMGAPVSVNTITAGENIITGTFTCGYTGNNSFDFFPKNLPAGTIIDFEEISVEEVVEETTTEEPTTAEPVTEEPTTEDPGPEADFKIASKTLALSSGISLVFKVNKSLFENRYSEPKIVVLLDGIETEITEYTDEGSRYAFEFTKITPDKMNVMVEATLHASKNGKEYVSPVVEYSVATYAYNMLNKYGETAGMETFRTLIVDLLNYGAASQNYTGFNTDNLANADLTAAQRSWATGDLGALTSVKNNKYVTIDNPSVLWKSAGLALQDAVIVRMKIQADSTDGLVVQVRDDYGTTWNIEPEDFELAAGTENQYYISFKGFNVGRMSESMYFTVLRNGVAVSNTYRYSVESYVEAHKNDEGTLGALVVAMMKYGKSAQAYSQG